jgi:hypothetical protein
MQKWRKEHETTFGVAGMLRILYDRLKTKLYTHETGMQMLRQRA